MVGLLIILVTDARSAGLKPRHVNQKRHRSLSPTEARRRGTVVYGSFLAERFNPTRRLQLRQS